MSTPPMPPFSLLQRLDNLGRGTLRFFRRTHRAVFRLAHDVVYVARKFIERVREILRLIAPAFALGHRLMHLRLSGKNPVRFYLLDPSYQEEFGHYRNVAQRLADECTRRGWAFFHLTGLKDQNTAGRIPFFADAARPLIRTFIPGVHQPRNAYNLCRRTTATLRRFLRALRVVLVLDRWLLRAPASYFYIHTGDLLHLWAFLDSSRLSPHQHLFCTQFYLPVHFEQLSEQTRFYRHAHLLATRLHAAHADTSRVHLCSDSPILLRNLAPALGSWPRLLPHPLLRPELLAALPQSESLAHRPHPCGYFGYFTPKYGWPVIERLLQQQADRDTRWLLGLNSKNKDQPHLDEIQRTAAAAQATLCLGYWPDDEYAAALDRCSALLLPYNPNLYAVLSSARLIDALCHGCFPVVPANTWLAEVVRTVDYGLIIEDAQWFHVPAHLTTLDFPALWAARRERVLSYLQQYTAAAFLDTLSRPPA
jgi:hypothetical protein